MFIEKGIINIRLIHSLTIIEIVTVANILRRLLPALLLVFILYCEESDGNTPMDNNNSEGIARFEECTSVDDMCEDERYACKSYNNVSDPNKNIISCERKTSTLHDPCDSTTDCGSGICKAIRTPRRIERTHSCQSKVGIIGSACIDNNDCPENVICKEDFVSTTSKANKNKRQSKTCQIALGSFGHPCNSNDDCQSMQDGFALTCEERDSIRTRDYPYDHPKSCRFPSCASDHAACPSGYLCFNLAVVPGNVMPRRAECLPLIGEGLGCGRSPDSTTFDNSNPCEMFINSDGENEQYGCRPFCSGLRCTGATERSELFICQTKGAENDGCIENEHCQDGLTCQQQGAGRSEYGLCKTP